MKECYASNKKEWRSWLRKNHLKEDRVDLISYKRHTGRPTFSHREAMEEAICFGWIDTTIRRIDEDRFARAFVKRGDKARWSENTLGYGGRLLKEGKMSKFGLQRYNEGLSRETHDYDIDRDPEMASELREALSKNKKAKENFDNFAPSYKRIYLVWLESAKLPETRARRIEEVVKRARANKKPNDA